MAYPIAPQMSVWIVSLSKEARYTSITQPPTPKDATLKQLLI